MVDQSRPGSHSALMCERLIRFYKYLNICLGNSEADMKLCNWLNDMIQSVSKILRLMVSIHDCCLCVQMVFVPPRIKERSCHNQIGKSLAGW